MGQLCQAGHQTECENMRKEMQNFIKHNYGGTSTTHEWKVQKEEISPTQINAMQKLSSMNCISKK
jgi:hypothetical protein